MPVEEGCELEALMVFSTLLSEGTVAEAWVMLRSAIFILEAEQVLKSLVGLSVDERL